MPILNNRFDNAPHTKTYAGSMKRITNYLARFETDESELADDLRRINYFVLQRADGYYIACAQLRPNEAYWCAALIDANICVTN